MLDLACKEKTTERGENNSWSRRKRKSSIIDYLPLLLSLFPLFSLVLAILTVLVLLQGNKNMFIRSEIVVKREWGTHLATGQGRVENAKSAGPFNRRLGPQPPTPLSIFTRPITIA